MNVRRYILRFTVGCYAIVPILGIYAYAQPSLTFNFQIVVLWFFSGLLGILAALTLRYTMGLYALAISLLAMVLNLYLIVRNFLESSEASSSVFGLVIAALFPVLLYFLLNEIKKIRRLPS